MVSFLLFILAVSAAFSVPFTLSILRETGWGESHADMLRRPPVLEPVAPRRPLADYARLASFMLLGWLVFVLELDGEAARG